MAHDHSIFSCPIMYLIYKTSVLLLSSKLEFILLLTNLYILLGLNHFNTFVAALFSRLHAFFSSAKAEGSPSGNFLRHL